MSISSMDHIIDSTVQSYLIADHILYSITETVRSTRGYSSRNKEILKG